MGKIKQIKAERKKARVEAEIKRKKRQKTLLVVALWGLLLLIVGTAGVFGYKYADAKWNTGTSIKNYVLSIKDMVIKDKAAEEAETERKLYTKVPDMVIDVNKEYVANFETNKGNFKIKLFAADAPKTVNNFVVLSRDGFYDGLTFHRIIKDFMIQGGDPEGTGTGGPGYQFEDEFNPHKLVRGVLAMANSGANTNGSQFFIVTAEATDWLDGKHTAFGEITEGMDVIIAIESVEVGENDKPSSPIVINKITIDEK